MPFIPHTEDDVREMLASIGVASIDALFDEIPQALRSGGLTQVPEGMSEMEVTRLMHAAPNATDAIRISLRAGAYEHHIRSGVAARQPWRIYSAYTPYQAEASQGTLQLLYEYQTMIASLTGMDVSNASLYDGASGLAEAVLMAVRAHRHSRRILMPKTVHPYYRRTVQAIVSAQNIELMELDFDAETGITTTLPEGDFAALVIPQPNFFGCLEDADALTDWAHDHGGLAIGLVNPTSLALLKAPGQWGANGADIATGEGQPLGAPLASGGPYFGFLACKQDFVRQMPGSIIGRTVDLEGKPDFTLTLQAREQHIRRAKATSNICTIKACWSPPRRSTSAARAGGLKRVALASHANTQALVAKLTQIPGVTLAFDRPLFHEAVLKLNTPAAGVLHALEAQGILGGFDLMPTYPELGNALLVCATETKTEADLQQFADHLARIMGRQQSAPPCPIKPKI